MILKGLKMNQYEEWIIEALQEMVKTKSIKRKKK